MMSAIRGEKIFLMRCASAKLPSHSRKGIVRWRDDYLALGCIPFSVSLVHVEDSHRRVKINEQRGPKLVLIILVSESRQKGAARRTNVVIAVAQRQPQFYAVRALYTYATLSPRLIGF
jgi:hypothetical protein